MSYPDPVTKKSMIALIPVPVLVALLLSTNLSGVGISYDTTEYFAGAKHLADSGAYSGVDGSPQATWPPGYSFLLSIPVRIGFSLESSSLITTGLSLAIIAIVVMVLLQRYSVSRTISVSALVVLFTLPPLIAASSVALSELPFIAAVLSSIVVVTWRRSRWIALAAGLLCGVAYMMRYVGLIFIPVVALCYPLRFARKAPARTLTLDVAVLLAAAAALPLWWTRRNFEVAGSATGNREPGGDLSLKLVDLP
jgi:4-amino-4-deoxy-L-arabinose transferase-like glycosyltransferase